MNQQVEQSVEAWSFTNLYKYNSKCHELSQQQRREKFLEDQKQKRHEITDRNRHLCDSIISELDIKEEKMDCDVTEQSIPRRKKFKLMLSEWFTEIPDDLEENWLTKICPQGFRVLFIARNNQTIVSTDERIILNIKSNFPGGGGTEARGITVLDCIFNKHTKTIFILDCLFWNSMSMLDSEASFRFFWLKTKFEENPDLTKYRKYTFSLLEALPACRSIIQDKMFTLLSVGEQQYPFDGVVFYHKESHYNFGYTPLVTWLASYMLPEKLHIDVSSENMFRKPKDYVCMEEYLENLGKKKKSRYHPQRYKNLEMEVQ